MTGVRGTPTIVLSSVATASVAPGGGGEVSGCFSSFLGLRVSVCVRVGTAVWGADRAGVPVWFALCNAVAHVGTLFALLTGAFVSLFARSALRVVVWVAWWAALLERVVRSAFTFPKQLMG